MRLTDAEMNLEGLEYSFGYDAGMIDELVLFQPNTNINHEQSELVTKEIVHRCKCHDALLKALEFYAAEENSVELVSGRRNILTDGGKIAKAAIAETTKERG